MVDLQCCVNFCTAKWLSYTYILFHIIFHYALSQDIKYSSLCYTVGPCYLSILYIRGPQPPGHGPVPVRGLLGTRMRRRRWAASKQAKLHLPLSIAHITAWTIPLSPPNPWKNCLPQNQSLVPKRLETAAIYNTLPLLIPNSHSFPPLPLSPLATTNLFSVSRFLFVDMLICTIF